ncbi:hypothetical protein [Natrinema versiforme]|uniref:Uncharacterized protein n=1 Tax=Natrinema versiforme TaxID=88724 RepID=A0A4P8WNA7_9EURY|nr:hypothetical protein [Natrinema versiforme]QCS43873.1 hypothetical protein FEJ81_16530 [Natrinema versiforme]
MEQWKTTAVILSGLWALIEIASFFASGIPSAIFFLLSVYQALVSTYPIIQRIIIYTSLISLGYLIGRRNTTDEQSNEDDDIEEYMPDSLHGCISYNGVSWRASTELVGNSNTRINVWPTPYCPKCQTELTKGRLPSETFEIAKPAWECENCGYTSERGDDTKTTVERIAKRNFERMTTSKGENHSLNTLAKKYAQTHGSKPTGYDIWKLYAEEVDDDVVATNCFP